MKKFYYPIAIILLSALLIVSFFCNKRPLIEKKTLLVSDTIVDSIPYSVDVPKPYPYKVLLPDTTWEKVDTAQILAEYKQLYKDYFSKKIYNRILLDDSNAKITLLDTLYRNEIGSGVLTYQNRVKTVINNEFNTYGEIPRNKCYVGAGIGVNNLLKNNTNLLQFNVGCIVATKKVWAFHAQTDILGLASKNYNFSFGIYYKIHSKSNGTKNIK